MKFSEAIEALLKGKTIKLGNDYYKYDKEKRDMELQHIVFSSAGFGTREYYRPSYESEFSLKEILSNDWELVEETYNTTPKLHSFTEAINALKDGKAIKRLDDTFWIVKDTTYIKEEAHLIRFCEQKLKFT